MKQRFSEAQIIGFLRESEAGLPVKDLCRRHGFSEASYYLWRKNHQEAAVGAQPAALEIREQALTHRRVLGRPFPQPERVFLAIRGDPERHHEAVLANVHPVEDQRNEFKAVERRRLPGPQLRRGLGDEPPAHAALARAPTHDISSAG